MWVTWKNVALALLVASLCVSADDSLADTCERGLWGGLLEEWALTEPEHSGRQGMCNLLATGSGLKSCASYLLTPFVARCPTRASTACVPASWRRAYSSK